MRHHLLRQYVHVPLRQIVPYASFHLQNKFSLVEDPLPLQNEREAET